MQAIGDSWIGTLVSQRMIPAFGPAIVAPVRARLRLKGGAVDGRRLRALEEEDRQLKHIVAEQVLDIQALKGVLAKKF